MNEGDKAQPEQNTFSDSNGPESAPTIQKNTEEFERLVSVFWELRQWDLEESRRRKTPK